MTRTRKRKIKKLTADIIAYILSIILIIILMFVGFGTISLIALLIESANIISIIISTTLAITAIFLELRKG